MYLAGTKTIRSMYNHIHVVTSSGTANSFLIAAAGATVISQLDDIVAADGVNNSGGGTYTYAHSQSDGNLEASGAITINDITLPQDEFIYVNQINATNGDAYAYRTHDVTNHYSYNRSTGNLAVAMIWATEYVVPELASDIVTLKIKTSASDYANVTSAVMELTDQDGNADATGAVSILPDANDTFQEFTYTPTSTYTSLEHVEIKITITSLDSGDTFDFRLVEVDL